MADKIIKRPQRRFSPEQQEAIARGGDLNVRIYSVTGGAGTGKTSVLGELHLTLETDLGKGKVALCAPTGRAAKRISELTGIPAVTIHRLLEFPQPDDVFDPNAEPNKPRRNRMNPLPYRVVIVDEASMLAPSLYAQLLDAMPNNGCLRFFGDNNQLAPVEDGKPPFVTLLKEQESTTLTMNFRSDDAIVGNSIRILEGRLPVRNDRFEIIYSGYPMDALIDFVTHDFQTTDYQVIMPQRVGKSGTSTINPKIQMKLNPSGPAVKLPRQFQKRHSDDDDETKAEQKEQPPLTVRAGDKFLWTKNDYALDMFNGEIGTVRWVEPEDGTLGITTPDKAVTVPTFIQTFSPVHGSHIHYDPRRHIELGYAITTHKSQGSEFDTIVYCVSSAASFMLERRNLYTAVTRARKRVVLIGDTTAVSRSLRKERPQGR